MDNRTKIMIVYGGDMSDTGRPGICTRSRMDKAFEIIMSNEGSWHIDLAAGISPDWPNYPALKEQMRWYFEGRLQSEGWEKAKFGNSLYKGERKRCIIITTSQYDAWGTFWESQALMRLQQGDTFERIVVTGANHMPRVKIIWKKYFHGTTPTFVSSSFEWNWRVLLELIYVPLTWMGFKSKHKPKN